MLALQSSMQSSGFYVMDADELFFINGGSAGAGTNHPGIQAAGNYLITTGQNICSQGQSADSVGTVAQALGSTSNWSALGAFANIFGMGMQAVGKALVWVAKNDSGDVQGAMDRYYEHH